MNKKEVTFRDPLVEQVVDQFIERSDVGFEKYKITLDEERKTKVKDLGRYLEDTKQELMDAVLYIQSAQDSLEDMDNFLKWGREHGKY